MKKYETEEDFFAAALFASSIATGLAQEASAAVGQETADRNKKSAYLPKSQTQSLR